MGIRVGAAIVAKNMALLLILPQLISKCVIYTSAWEKKGRDFERYVRVPLQRFMKSGKHMQQEWNYDQACYCGDKNGA